MTDNADGRHVVRLACGHEALEVVPPGKSPTPVGERFLCRECHRHQAIVDSFEVEP